MVDEEPTRRARSLSAGSNNREESERCVQTRSGFKANHVPVEVSAGEAFVGRRPGGLSKEAAGEKVGQVN